MIEVVVANEYDLRDNVERFRAGRYARHLLFGVQRLQPPGFRARLVGESLPGVLNRRPIRFLVTNVRAAWAGQRADVVYSTFTYGAVLAGLVRTVTRRPRRVVTVLHGLPRLLARHPRLFRLLYGGHDALAFLSPTDLDAVRAHLPARQQATWVPWGPSQAWAEAVGARSGAASGGAPFALAVGRSKRDWDTLRRAHEHGGFPLVVVAGADCPLQDGPRLAVHKPAAGQREALPLADLTALYREASVVVLPLVEDTSLNGLTALGEALASRSTVVMTRTPAMRGVAAQHGQWVVLVPPQDPAALAGAVARALAAGPPDAELALPTAERFEAVVLGLIRGPEDGPRTP
ncbi:glycosyltransferase [Quadrisphaera sp. DSM 44207]|uniref:glycosyltransferase n=1 Tax=Quadrisphaera sp. DSM 44207 TaxID=1881057 RepID=UPI000891FF2D|nr:glycosyltransferase [Quadrisphaera sp. DSM 44207]SDQ66953.1 Glycosyl transferases group 1 [Quadrisphaera sp. DSM 44207]